MAKITRQERAEALARMLARGPHFSNNLAGAPFNPAEASAQYQRWADTWILDSLRALVPELRATRARR